MFRNAAGLAQDHERYSSKAPLVALVLDIAIRDVIVRKSVIPVPRLRQYCILGT